MSTITTYSSLAAFPPEPAPLAASSFPAGPTTTTLNGTAVPASFPGEPALPSDKPTVTDVSYFAAIDILGPDAEALVAGMLPAAGIKALAPSTILPVDISGTPVALWRMCDTNFRAVVKAPGGTDAVIGALKAAVGSSGLKRVKVVDASSNFCTLSLLDSSDKADALKTVWTSKARASVADLLPGKFTIGRIGDDHGTPLLVAKEAVGRYEVWCGPKDAAHVWNLFTGVERVGVDAWRKSVQI